MRFFKVLFNNLRMSESQFVRKGEIWVYTGPMKSGKSKALIFMLDKIRHAKIPFIAIKPETDTRELHIRNSQDNFPKWEYLDSGNPSLRSQRFFDAPVIVIDEAQFFGSSLVGEILFHQKQGKHILIAGLDLDFKGRPFGIMPEILSHANKIEKLDAACEYDWCSQPARFTQRLINGNPANYNEPLVSVEGNKKNETYQARCLNHHFVPGRP